MKYRVKLLLPIILVCFGIFSTAQAEVEYNVLKTYKLDDPPVAMAFSVKRNEIYVLNQKGELLIYETNGNLTEKINVGQGFDGLELIEGSDVLFLTSRKNKTIQVVQLQFVQDIDVTGSPFKGPENAPVVIAVFSEFQ
jgi:hypothetical protein